MRNKAEITPYDSARHWAAFYIEEKFNTMWQYREPVINDRSPVDIHDMRVASRRLRSVLLDFRTCIPKHTVKTLFRLTKKLTEHLGLVRDMDILTELLSQNKTCDNANRQSLTDFLFESAKHRRNEGRDHLLQFFQTLEQEHYPLQFEQLISLLRNGKTT
jgi:CHAD domain-containing protein